MSEAHAPTTYAIGCAEYSFVKIGTTVRLAARLASLQTGSPYLLHVIWQREGGRDLEEYLHFRLDDYRVRGEWFDFAGRDPVAMIKGAADLYGVDPASVAATAQLTLLSERYLEIKEKREEARVELADAIAAVLSARIPGLGPAEVSRLVPYVPEHVNYIARAAGVPPLRERTVVSVKQAQE